MRSLGAGPGRWTVRLGGVLLVLAGCGATPEQLPTAPAVSASLTVEAAAECAPTTGRLWIVVDGQTVAPLRPGSTLTLALLPGDRRVRVEGELGPEAARRLELVPGARAVLEASCGPGGTLGLALR